MLRGCLDASKAPKMLSFGNGQDELDSYLSNSYVCEEQQLEGGGVSQVLERIANR